MGEGQHRVRVKPVERADQLPPEHLEAMQAVSLCAAKVETVGAPVRVGIAGIAANDVEARIPFRTTKFGSHRLRQRRVEGAVPSDAEQLARRVVEQVRQLLDLALGQKVAGDQVELALDLCDTRQIAKNDWAHGQRIDEIRGGSKTKVQRIHKFKIYSAAAGSSVNASHARTASADRRSGCGGFPRWACRAARRCRWRWP